MKNFRKITDWYFSKNHYPTGAFLDRLRCDIFVTPIYIPAD